MAAYSLPAALILYLVGILLGVVGTVYRSERAQRGATAVFVVAWALHLVAVGRRAALIGGVPITNAAEYLMVLSWIVQTIYLLVWVRWRIQVAGLVLPPVAVLTGLIAFELLPAGGAATGERVHRGWQLFHITVSTLGMAILSLAFAMSLIYLLKDHALKSKRTLKLLDRFPPLDRCDQIVVHALTLGFVLLTIGIATGVVWLLDEAAGDTLLLSERWWKVLAKLTFPLLAWLVFAAILISRKFLGFRGRKSAYLIIAGFALGLLTVVGMTL